jgi:Raf kinase inhibitor-like YbhB/YbcL family protein
VDPGAQDGPFTHWLVYGLSPLATSLPQDLPAVPRDTLDVVQYDQGVNDAGKIGYYGPAPPPGRPHRYQFTLYALSAPTGLPAGAQKGQVLRALEGKVLGKATLEGLYGR